MILSQFADFVADAYGGAAPPSTKRTPGARLRQREGVWDQASFIRHVDENYPELKAAHENLLNLLDGMDVVKTDLDSGGPPRKSMGYQARLTGLPVGVLRIGADGDIYVDWNPNGDSQCAQQIAVFREKLKGLVETKNATGVHLPPGTITDLAAIDKLALALQAIHDRLVRVPQEHE